MIVGVSTFPGRKVKEPCCNEAAVGVWYSSSLRVAYPSPISNMHLSRTLIEYLSRRRRTAVIRGLINTFGTLCCEIRTHGHSELRFHSLFLSQTIRINVVPQRSQHRVDRDVASEREVVEFLNLKLWRACCFCMRPGGGVGVLAGCVWLLCRGRNTAICV